jgi:hypothetical protein
MSGPELVGNGHENVVKLRRALSYRTPVNRTAVQPEQHGNVTNQRGPRPASQRHGRRAEAGGKAAATGGKPAKGRSGDKHSGISRDIVIRSNFIVRAKFNDGEDCQA